MADVDLVKRLRVAAAKGRGVSLRPDEAKQVWQDMLQMGQFIGALELSEITVTVPVEGFCAAVAAMFEPRNSDVLLGPNRIRPGWNVLSQEGAALAEENTLAEALIAYVGRECPDVTKEVKIVLNGPAIREQIDRLVESLNQPLITEGE